MPKRPLDNKSVEDGQSTSSPDAKRAKKSKAEKNWHDEVDWSLNRLTSVRDGEEFVDNLKLLMKRLTFEKIDTQRPLKLRDLKADDLKDLARELLPMVAAIQALAEDSKGNLPSYPTSRRIRDYQRWKVEDQLTDEVEGSWSNEISSHSSHEDSEEEEMSPAQPEKRYKASGDQRESRTLQKPVIQEQWPASAQQPQPSTAQQQAPTGAQALPTNSLKLPSLDVLTKWTIADIPSSLPPLPKVLDPTLETAAFTHPGMCPKPTDLNYERLEWVGDSYIYVLSCGFIYPTFTTLSPGKCSQLREILVRNSTLASYSLQYGFDKRANFPAEFGLAGRRGGTKVTDGVRTKVLGDLFEAFVAAVVLSDPKDGFARLAAWLKGLWAVTIQKDIRRAADLEKKAEELPPKSQLANLIMVKGIRLRYEDAVNAKPRKDKNTRAPLYTVNVYLDGWGETNKLLGWGTAANKSEAGHKAARYAMGQNRKVLEVYSAMKRDHMAAMEAQQMEK